jgi:two-component system chemotaxis sensor kinase CheA
MAQDPYKYFRIEARELAEQLARGTLELEKSAQPADVVARLLRLAHTLKGAARVVRQREIADAAHAIEDVLAPFRESASALPKETIDSILRLVDKVTALEKALVAPGEPAPAASAAARPVAQDEALRTVRADTAEMDTLLDGLSETHSLLAAVRQAAIRPLERIERLANLVAAQLAAPRRPGTLQANAAGTLAMIAPLVAELQELVGGLERRLTDGVEQVDREIRQTRDVAERLRLLPVATVFDQLERTARDAAQLLGKRVTFEGIGGDVRLDAHVLGILQGALVQLVRNAVAHGIEPDAARRAAGKPPEGRIRVEASRRGKRAVFACSDDGRGIDIEGIRMVAERKGLLPAGSKPDPDALLDLLFKGGISTSRTVNEVSGRGVGLDVVRETVERLGGSVRVETEAGKKTRVELTVSISMSSLDALIVEAAGVRAAVPLDRVHRALRQAPDAITRTPAGTSILHENQAIAYVELGDCLARQDRETPAAGNRSAVVMDVGGVMTAVGVDRLLGIENIVLRTLPGLAPADAIVSGASLDAEGNPRIVLDVDRLSARARQADTGTASPSTPSLPILVIDDSPTTRMLEQSILEAAGYETDTATSAEEALQKAKQRRYGLFLVDVEMPGMDGFAFVELTRADPQMRLVPAILVTSRNAPDDLQRGRDAGACGYIVKSEFDQADLLQRIRKAME